MIAAVERGLAGVRFCDESDAGFGWISPRRPRLEMASHALRAGDGVWLVDASDFPGLDERVRALGEPRGVLRLFGEHGRDGAAIAVRLGVPLLAGAEELAGAPFHPVALGGPFRWDEVALWWPERKTLVVPEAVGTAPFYRAGADPLGVHPLLRLARPPRELLALEPEHVLCGHGPGLHTDAAAALARAVRRARRDFPRTLPRIVSAALGELRR
jgi:hypothetical protein